MTAKEYLMQIRKLNAQINHKKLELESIRNEMSGLKGISYDKKEALSSRSVLSPQEKYIHKYLSYECQIQKELTKLVELKENAIKLIDTIDDGILVELIYNRYIHCLNWKEISKRMNYSVDHLFKLHGKALNELNNKITVNNI